MRDRFSRVGLDATSLGEAVPGRSPASTRLRNSCNCEAIGEPRFRGPLAAAAASGGGVQLAYHLMPQLSKLAERNHRPTVKTWHRADGVRRACCPVGQIAHGAFLGGQRCFVVRLAVRRLKSAENPVAAVAVRRRGAPTAASAPRPPRTSVHDAVGEV